jgi:hypothetical protein
VFRKLLVHISVGVVLPINRFVFRRLLVHISVGVLAPSVLDVFRRSLVHISVGVFAPSALDLCSGDHTFLLRLDRSFFFYSLAPRVCYGVI